MHYMLFYDYVPDYLERREPLREAHLKMVKAAVDRGEVLLGGPFANPADGAMILFSGDSPAVAESFARADPYVTNKLVTNWWVREWTTVVGRDAAAPVPLPSQD